MTERGQELLQYFRNHQQDFLSLLKSLVELETPSDDPSSFSEIFSLLTEEFEELNFSVTRIEGEKTGGQLLCTPKDTDPQKPNQLILGHCDTVWETGTLDQMPFTVEGNEISGPGIYDMKAGIAMMIFALKAITELNSEMSHQPIFLINTDEEIGSNESKELIIEQAKKSARTFVLEPSLGSEGKIKTARKGIGEFEVTINGTPSHAGLAPEEGVSAILGLSHIVQQLFKLNDPSSGISVNVGTIEGGERSNVIAAQSKAVIDVRIPTKEDGERIKEKIYNLESDMDGIELEISGGINRPPLEKGPANKQLWQTTKKLGKELGIELEEGTSGGASDGNFTNLYSPTIDGLGAVGEGAHAYHEKIFLDETIKRLALFTLLLQQPDIGK
ncbi:M20 family metallopeptidase [Fodinibius halophilus]|uniref:M20 family metallopeptidase n=1 Tax=Fodinibius halophilus TaxID=1736908 RepID=A0A6M1T9V0_9BACT|nr:M20 family metallopeptidase [Fodinibius halophilus]NGP88811.1 M20 family metallopeptidase [Fodinibius halophilus]